MMPVSLNAILLPARNKLALLRQVVNTVAVQTFRNLPITLGQHGASERPSVTTATETALPESNNITASETTPDWLSKEEPELLIASGFFDAEWYLSFYNDVKESGFGALEHFIRDGWTEQRKPNAFFDPIWYAEAYSDVSEAGYDALMHFIQHGSAEGRSPSIDFDMAWYRSQHPDVVSSGENPVSHYLREGKAQGWPTLDPDADYRMSVIADVQRLRLEAGELSRHIAMMYTTPRFAVFIEGGDEDARQITALSVKRQIYAAVVIDQIDLSLGFGKVSGNDVDFMLWVQAGDVLHDRAIYEYAAFLNAEPNVDMVYVDEDVLGPLGRRSPFFKPDWSPDLLESFNYVGAGTCFRMTVADQVIAGATDLYDFILRFTERTSAIGHVRQVLYHRTRSSASSIDASLVSQNCAALRGRLKRTGRTGVVEPVMPGYPCSTIRTALRREPLVSIVIPTAGRTVEVDGRCIDILMNSLDTIKERSSYKNLEFIVIDDGDLGDEREETLHQRSIQRITYIDPVLNGSKKLNMGVENAKGELLLLLSDDVEPLNADWIERLVEQFDKCHVGVVGAKLLYADHTTQHVGVVTNYGCPDHVRRLRPRDEPGYFFSTCTTRNYLAVSGACMMTPAKLYRQVGGYTEALAGGLSDVDYCLKLREVTKLSVYCPNVELRRFESRSRELEIDASERSYFMKRWAAMTTFDPYYNEQFLSVAPPTFEVRNNRRLIG